MNAKTGSDSTEAARAASGLIRASEVPPPKGAAQPDKKVTRPDPPRAAAESARRQDGDAEAILTRIKRRDRAMLLFNALIAIGGLVATAVFGLLLYQMYLSLRLNREALDLARESTQRQLRAYVGVQDFKCGGCGDNAGVDEVFIRVSNDGLTPAMNTFARIGWNVGDAGCGASDSSFSYNYSQARYLKSFRTLPKDAKDATAFDPNREVIQQARTSGGRLCVYGTVNYKTIFNDLGERETRFCFWYTRGSERVLCEDHNDQN